MRISAQINVTAPASAVWETITDPSHAVHILAGVTRWEPAGGPRVGLGARYRMLMRVGSAEMGGLIEVVEWDEGRDMAWASVTGLDQRGRWRLRERVPGRTHVELRLAGGVAGSGLGGWLAEQVATPTMQRNLHISLAQMKKQVEHEEQRRAAARRRANAVIA